MKYKTRILPLETQLILGVIVIGIVLLGDRLIHGYFWSLTYFGEHMVRFLQWSGACPQ